ncbi:MurR/RpiR family transcriptional regulator [Paenibacillus sp. FSL R5-0887]|jgi:DNA-binding MurR/RpiR family transcriptional regulator|uniref:Transcriptional regulator n=1 Tax=Paenibacillus odorifer TaxID=189426 RepID=A0ABX3GLG4_9BACL|nr:MULTISPECIES: MurR/RpiR family transcriptional regulator [Paenibacillus]MDH6430811.1 DNA-binding MurR/RpiR family transcriptional regulator [Paenibacillus sp. PastH-4]MDH6446753.1 DNA-binding MurR/RpiR family transcriptional regulator [Paenibacillus sp. PastF-4]MDH6531163.1 DNA-binding MurR/RpiR family transcriptional regulator [Paenibacillus sp. PastH-3]OMC67913.1 transcriptional regulator [Paenibacillus odorifer]OMC73984.1 transcriptional regulator [Paenibacillus odorifer]
MSPILHALEHEKAKLSQMERKLAERILSSPGEIVHMGITELAEQCGISPATITRFCKVLHFKGFPDFKVKLAAEIAHSDAAPQDGGSSYQDIVAGNPLSVIVEAMQTNHLTSIRDTTSLLDLERLQAAVHLLCQARRVDLYGMATSSIVAQDFYQKLIRIGVNCTAFADSHMQITSASSLSEGDVVFAVSYSGETPETIDALMCAKASGASTIALTSYGSSTLATLADIPLFSSSLEKGMRRGDMASRIAQLHIIDILFTGMVSTRFGDFIPRLEQSYLNVQQYRNKRGGQS